MRGALLIGLLLGGCSQRAINPCQHDGDVLPDLGPDPRDLSLADLTRIPPPEFCFEILTVDTDKTLWDFRPETRQFNLIGTLDCIGTRDDSPFSMALGRDGTAYVHYQSGFVFAVDVKTGLCKPTNFEPKQMGVWDNFGMGFVSDEAGSDQETLFIAGTTAMQLATVDLPMKRVHPVNMLLGMPELTGTGTGELWGFFPGQTTFVAQIDKVTARTSNRIDLPPLAGDPAAWAFAAYGGDFWIFLQRQTDPSTRVARLRRDGFFETIIGNSGRRIVGAGVSTCAPTTMDMGIR